MARVQRDMGGQVALDGGGCTRRRFYDPEAELRQREDGPEERDGHANQATSQTSVRPAAVHRMPSTRSPVGLSNVRATHSFGLIVSRKVRGAAPARRSEALPVLLGMQRADVVAFVLDEAARLRPPDDCLDHARIAAQEDVEV